MATLITDNINFSMQVPKGAKLTEPRPAWVNDLQKIDIERIKSIIKSPFLATAPSDLPSFSGGATSTVGCGSDIRAALSYQMPVGPVNHVMGLSSAGNVFHGSLDAKNAYERCKRAVEIGDSKGAVAAAIDVIRSGTQALGGLFSLPHRIMMVISECLPKGAAVTAQSAASIGLFTTAAFVMGCIVNAFFLACSVKATAWAAFMFGEDWYRDLQLNLAWNANAEGMTASTWFENIAKKLFIDSADKLTKLHDGEDFEGKKKKWANAALDVFANQFMQLQQVAQSSTPISDSEARGFFEAVFNGRSADFQKIREEFISSMGLSENPHVSELSTLELIGFRLEEMKRQSKRESKFTRATSSDCLEAVKKAASRGLLQRLNSEDAVVKKLAEGKVQKLKDMAWNANTINKVTHVAIIIGGGLSIAFGVMGFITSIPALLPIGAIVSLVSSLWMAGIDGASAAAGLNSGPPGRHDETFLLITSALIVISIAVSAGLTLGIAPVTAAATTGFIIAGIWAIIALSMCFGAVVKTREKMLQWEKDHPDLQRLQNVLEKDGLEYAPVDQEAMEMFEKLPEEHREAVRAKYIAMSGTMGFKTQKYRDVWNKGHDFGGAFIEQLRSGGFPSLDAVEVELFQRGVKDSVIHFWKKYEEEKTDENNQIALQMQALFDAVKGRDIAKMRTAVQSISKDHPAAFTRLKQDLWYVVKRQEDKKDFKKVIDAVMKDREDQKNALGEELVKNTNSFVERVNTFLHPANPV